MAHSDFKVLIEETNKRDARIKAIRKIISWDTWYTAVLEV